MTYRTANLQSCILYIYSTNIGTEYFKHGVYCSFFSLQNAVCFIILHFLVPVLFTFYIQGVLKLKKNNSGARRLTASSLYLFTVEMILGRNRARMTQQRQTFCRNSEGRVALKKSRCFWERIILKWIYKICILLQWDGGSTTLLRKWKLTVGSRNQAVRCGNNESWFCPRLKKRTSVLKIVHNALDFEESNIL